MKNTAGKQDDPNSSSDHHTSSKNMASALRRVKNSFFTPPDPEHDARIAALKAELYDVVQDVPVRTWRSTIWDSLE